MEYLIHILILVGIWAILGLSLNLIMGYTGLISVTHAAFFGIGAYTTAILDTQYGVNFFVSLPIGILLSGVLSVLIGLVLARFKDDYFVLGSMGFNVIVWSIMLNWQELTRGPLGIPGIGRPEAFGFVFQENAFFLLLVAVFTYLSYLTAKWLSNSSFGRVLKSIREDEEAIKVFGYNTNVYKLTVFVIGAGIASVAGSFFASYITFIDPSSFQLLESVFVLTAIILGGLASNEGAVLGAFLLIVIPEILRFAGFPSDVAAQMRQAVFGLSLILLMLYRPQGIVGEYKL